MTGNETLLGTEEGTISVRPVGRFAAASKCHNKELMDQMVGVPWGQGTTIGRPKRARPLPALGLIPEESKAEEADVGLEKPTHPDSIFDAPV